MSSGVFVHLRVYTVYERIYEYRVFIQGVSRQGFPDGDGMIGWCFCTDPGRAATPEDSQADPCHGGGADGTCYSTKSAKQGVLRMEFLSNQRQSIYCYIAYLGNYMVTLNYFGKNTFTLIAWLRITT